MSGRTWQLLQPWIGLIAGLSGVALAHQFGADGVFDDCQNFSPAPLLIVATLCIVIALAGAWVSAAIVRQGSADSTSCIVATISTGFALLTCFAIVLPMLASIILPPCFQ